MSRGYCEACGARVRDSRDSGLSGPTFGGLINICFTIPIQITFAPFAWLGRLALGKPRRRSMPFQL